MLDEQGPFCLGLGRNYVGNEPRGDIDETEQVVRSLRNGYGVMDIAGMVGLSYPVKRLAIDLYKEGGL